MKKQKSVLGSMLLVALMSENVGGVFIKEESRRCNNASISIQENTFYKVLT